VIWIKIVGDIRVWRIRCIKYLAQVAQNAATAAASTKANWHFGGSFCSRSFTLCNGI